MRTEVLVVGSGAGGATTAATLSEAGLSVLVLEEGSRHSLSDYGKIPIEAMPLLYRNKGMTPILGRVPIGFVEGRCLGGSTEINSGLWQRLAPEFVLRWKAQYDLDDFSLSGLDPYFQWAEEQLHVARRPNNWPASTLVLKAGADALGWSAEEAARAAKDCVNTNRCASGCPKGAKQGMSRNLIPFAEKLGAKFLSDCKVRRLVKIKNKVLAVEADLRRDGQIIPTLIEADHVFICAGPTQTPLLLRKSGIKFNIGDNFRIHPMLKVSALFDENLDAEHSVLPLVQIKEFWPDIALGGSFFSPGHTAMILSENWSINQMYMDSYERMANYYVSVRGTGEGSVRSAPFGEERAMLRYELSEVDLRNLSQGLARLGSMLLAAGAKKIFPGVQGCPIIDNEMSAARWLDHTLPPSALSLTTIHAFSACPIGENEDKCAADSFGKIRDYDNLYINDASMLPDSPGTNPQGVIMALARRNAMHFKESRN